MPAHDSVSFDQPVIQFLIRIEKIPLWTLVSISPTVILELSGREFAFTKTGIVQRYISAYLALLNAL